MNSLPNANQTDSPGLLIGMKEVLLAAVGLPYRESISCDDCVMLDVSKRQSRCLLIGMGEVVLLTAACVLEGYSFRMIACMICRQTPIRMLAYRS
jgi:hypothetical protein